MNETVPTSAVTNSDQVLTFAVTGKPAKLHPILASDALSERISALLFAPLIDFDQEQKPIPGLLAWQNPSPREYVLSLRHPTPRFSDGNAIKVDDVLATIEAARDWPNSPHAANLKHLEHLNATEDGRIQVRLNRDDPRFVEKLHIGLLPASHVDEPEQFIRAPIASGAFDWLAWHDDGVRLQRRSDGQQIDFVAVPDPTMRALKLIKGEADLLQNDLPGEISDYLAQRPELTRRSVPGTTFSYLGFNLADPITGQLSVRQAIAHAIDRASITHHLFRDQAQRAQTLLIPQHWAAARDLPDYTYDPEKARRLLHALGYTPQQPLRLSYKTSTDPFRLRIASVLQAQLAEVGIQLDIQSYEWGTFFGDIKAGRFQLYSLSWVGIRSPDIYRHIYHSASLPPGGANRGRYQREKVDRLLEQAEQLPSEQAAAVYQQVQAQVHADLVYVPLWHEYQQLISRADLQAQPDALGSYRFLEKVSLSDD